MGIKCIRTSVYEQFCDLGVSLLRSFGLYLAATFFTALFVTLHHIVDGTLPKSVEGKSLFSIATAPFITLTPWEHVFLASFFIVAQEFYFTLEYMAKSGQLTSTLAQFTLEENNPLLAEEAEEWEEDAGEGQDNDAVEDDPEVGHECTFAILVFVGSILVTIVKKLFRLWKALLACFLFLPSRKDGG